MRKPVALALSVALVAVVVVLVAIGAGRGPGFTERANSVAPLGEGFERSPVGVWAEGSTHGAWRVEYNGYGPVQVVQAGGAFGRVLQAAPQAATSPGATHAAMVVSVPEFGGLTYTVQARTVKQLRTGSVPNPWETDWIVWHWSDTPQGEVFYYLAAKTNGWELGKVDYAYPGGQRYLADGPSPAFPVGRWHTYQVRQVGAVITVSVDGRQVASVTDTERPYLSGRVGLYVEDARVQFDNILVEPVS